MDARAGKVGSMEEKKVIPISEYKALADAQAQKFIEMSLTSEEKVLREFNSKYAIVRTSTAYVLVQRSKAAFELVHHVV